MKAVTYARYGTPDELRLEELPRPVPRDHEVLVRVAAVSLNGSDNEGLRGYPFYVRFTGPFRPTRRILGSDIAGTVESVGAKVTRFKPGDAVFGDILTWMGGLAEYARAPESALAAKPAALSFADAAALPQAGVIALQAMREGKVGPGSRVLINGAGGAAGSFAIQLARHLGAEITAVDNADKLAFMRSLGASHVIDYRAEDFTRTGATYDLILDLYGTGHPLAAYARALARGGRYCFVGGTVRTLLRVLIGGLVFRLAGKRLGLLLVRQSPAAMLEVAGLVEAGVLRPIIDGTYPLAEAKTAFQRLAAAKALGKLVILPNP